jgi:uncharacterized linocin/CFP29 family protein
MQMNNGRDKLPWSQEIWDRIDQAVHEECARTKIAEKFLPPHGPLDVGTLTVPSDTVIVDRQTLTVNEAATTPIIELLVEFALTPQQVEREEELMTAVTLATRAANLLSQAEDVVLFQGQSAIDGSAGTQHPLFRDNKVQARSGPAGSGLLNAATSDIQVVQVPALDSAERPQGWGENIFRAVAEAYSRLQSGEGLAQAHYGPYALVLHFVPYADTHSPLEDESVVITADRIKPLVMDMMYGPASQSNGQSDYKHKTHFYGTGTLPFFRGLMLSLGGNTMDLVVGMPPTVAFLTEDADGDYRFRVYERFALRLKDPSSVIRLEFAEQSTAPVG